MKPIHAITTISLATFGIASMGCGEMDRDETVASALLSGQLPVAFQDNLHAYAVENASGTKTVPGSGDQMTSLTVPSQVMLPDGSWEVGFQKLGSGHFMVDHFVGPFSHSMTDSGG